MADKHETKEQKQPKPATSVHLRYKLPSFDVAQVKEIKFHNNVTVTDSHNCTYFAVIQFWNGGYCGIQQRSSPEDKIAIFSVWNENENNVELVDQGANVKVEPFGGEGTGLKSTRPLPWQLNESVGFTVTCRTLDDNYYEMRCDVEFRGESIYMATYKRKKSFPMESFVCFVEDYQRQPGIHGMLHPRCGYFHDAFCEINGERHELKETKFSKVQSGHDLHGNDRCTAGVDAGRRSFFLRTGHCEPLDNCCCYGDTFRITDGKEKRSD